MNSHLALPGLLLATWSTARLWCGWASRRWPVATGEVVRSIYERRHKGSPYYVREVWYRYAVGHAKFAGRRRRFGALPELLSQEFATEQAAYERVDGPAPGSHVPVYHHPRFPRLAVLRPGYTVDALISLALGVLLVVYARHR